jgi:hypothetical protein
LSAASYFTTITQLTFRGELTTVWRMPLSLHVKDYWQQLQMNTWYNWNIVVTGVKHHNTTLPKWTTDCKEWLLVIRCKIKFVYPIYHLFFDLWQLKHTSIERFSILYTIFILNHKQIWVWTIYSYKNHFIWPWH